MLRSTACNNSNARQSRARDTLRLSFPVDANCRQTGCTSCNSDPTLPAVGGSMRYADEWWESVVGRTNDFNVCEHGAGQSKSGTFDPRFAHGSNPADRMCTTPSARASVRICRAAPAGRDLAHLSSRVSLETCCGWLAKSLLVWEAYCVHKASLILSVMYTATHRIADVQVQHL